MLTKKYDCLDERVRLQLGNYVFSVVEYAMFMSTSITLCRQVVKLGMSTTYRHEACR